MTTPSDPVQPEGVNRDAPASEAKINRKKPRFSRGKLWARRIVVTVVVIGVLLGVGWWGLKGPITRAIVLSKLQQALGSPVEADVVELRPDGSLLLKGVRLRAPTSNSQASQVLTADQIEVYLSLGDSGPIPQRLVITRPMVRLSREKGTGTLNVLKLSPPTTTGSGPLLLPEIQISDGTLEFGEHDAFGYTVLKSVPMSGQVLPLPDVDSGGYTITIVTASGLADSPSVPLRIVGSIGEDGVEVRLDRVRLQEWVPHSVPAEFRDLIAALDMRGDVSSVQFTANMDGTDLKTEVLLDGVRMKLPLRRWITPTTDDSEQPLDVVVRTGKLVVTNQGLRADLKGSAAEVPVVISLDHRGLDLDAPFDVVVDIVGYNLPRDPNWLPYAPDAVRVRLDSFSKPTAIIDGRVTARRAEQGGEALVEGALSFRNAVAAFEGFPYEMQELSGRASFTKDLLLIEDIQGRSVQGASIVASARIEPPTSIAEVLVEVQVKDGPLDDAMIEAMGEGRRRIVEALFYRPSYEDLLAKELIGPMASEHVEEFHFGGTVDVSVSVHRALGEVSIWTRQIDVRLEEAGLIPEAFPLPVIAEDVTIKLDGNTARVEGGRFRTLTGEGIAEISAEVDIAEGSEMSSTILIEANTITIDDRLIYAISNAGAVQRGAAVVTSAVRGLRLDGLVDCRATLKASVAGDDDRTEYNAVITLHDLTAQPAGGDGSLQLRGVSGVIEANNAEAALHFEGGIFHNNLEAGDADLTVSVSRGEDAKDDGGFAGTIHLDRLNIAAPVEDLVRVFADDTAKTLVILREEFSPTGRATLTVQLDGEGANVSSTVVDVLSTDQAEALTPIGRIWLTQADGTIRYRADAGTGAQGSVDFIESRGSVGQGVQRVADYAADGPWALSDDQLPRIAQTPLSLRLQRIDAAADLTRAIVERALPDALHADVDRLNPSGEFAADLLLNAPQGRLEVRGSLTPGRMEITRGDRRVSVERQAGSVLLGPESRPSGGAFQGLRLAIGDQEPRTLLHVDGGWVHHEQAGGKLDLQMTADAQRGLDDDLLTMLPEPVSVALLGAGVSSDQPMRVELTTLEVHWTPGVPTSFSLNGDATMNNVSLQVGAPVTGMDGLVRYAASSDGGTIDYTIEVAAERMRLAGVRATQGLVLLTNGNAGEIVAIPQISAAMHGGRIAGSAVLREDENTPELVRYIADLRMASVSFADVLSDLNIKPDHLEQYEKPPVSMAQDNSRGQMDARIGLSGLLGDVSQTLGRGSLVIGGGAVVDLPLVLPLIQVSNLEMPSNDTVDMAEATFVIQGDLLQFEKLSVYTPSVEIAGHGTMRWTDLSLDLRFASRRVRRIPMLSEAIERFRDELVTTRVSGSLNSPVISVVQFSGTRRLLSRLVGGSDDEAAARLDHARRLAMERERIRRVDDRASRFLTTPMDNKKQSDGGTQ